MPKFPEDFKKSMHAVVPGAKQWTLADSTGETVISIVGGGMGLYGNGVDTFEMYDFREGDVQGHLTVDEINAHLEAYPLP